MVADQVQAWALLAFEEGVADEVERRVPVSVLEDAPGGEVAPDVGMGLLGADQEGAALLFGDGQRGVGFGE